MDRYTQPQESYNTNNCGYTSHLTYKPMRTYRDVVAQAYNIQSTDNHNANTGEIFTDTNLQQYERYNSYKDNDEHLDTGDRYNNEHEKNFNNSNNNNNNNSDYRRGFEFANTQNERTGYDDKRYDHKLTTSLNSAGISARTDSQGSSKSSIREEAPIDMLSLPTINERICIRWASQKGWEPYMEGMNKVSEPINSWLLTSMNNYYIDLRILHPWNWQQNQQEQEMQLRRIQILSGYGRLKNDKGKVRDDGTMFVGNGGPFHRNSPLYVSGQPLDLPDNSVVTIPSNSNPIIMDTSIERLSAGHYVRSEKKVVHPMVTTEPSSISSQNIHVTWSEWINGEPAGIDIGMGAGHQTVSMLSWQATLGTYTTRIEYEGSTTFRIIGQRMNPVMHTEGAYQEGWKVVPIASMPLSSKVSLSTSSRTIIDQYRTVRDREIDNNRTDDGSSKNTNRNMPRHRCDENCRRANNDIVEMRATSYPQKRSTPSAKISLDTISHSNPNRVTYLPKTKKILTQARTCIVLCYEDPSYQARGMVIRVGDHCQGILRLGDHITVERWQWYPGAAESAASLNTVARTEAAARKSENRIGSNSDNAGNYEDKLCQEACNIRRGDMNSMVVISDDSDEVAHGPTSASTTGSTPTLIGSEAPISSSTPLRTPAPTPASIAAVTDSGAGWKREVRIGQGYLPCSIAFGVSAPRIREGTSVNFMGMIWEVIEVFNW